MTNNILIADDEADLAEVYEEVVKTNIPESRVTTVPDGAQAYEALKQDSYSLLVTDHRMPNLTGADLILKIREEGNQIPVIFVSSYVPEVKDKVETFDDLLFIDKPVESDRLVRYIKMLLAKA